MSLQVTLQTVMRGEFQTWSSPNALIRPPLHSGSLNGAHMPPGWGVSLLVIVIKQ